MLLHIFDRVNFDYRYNNWVFFYDDQFCTIIKFMNNEFEIKFLNINKDKLANILSSKDFKLKHPEYTMKRKTFDFSKVSPGKNKWGRVRQEADKVTMTIKEVCNDKIDGTYEIELIVDNFENASSFFQECGIYAKAYQENKRELWERGSVVVTIDTWPGINPFVEIEGNSIDEVKNICTELGFVFEDGVFGSIDMVYEKLLGIPAQNIIVLPEITFSKPPKSTI